MFLDDQGVSQEIDRDMRIVQEEMRKDVDGSLRSAVKMGGVLQRAKLACYLGKFGAWLKGHFKGSPRKAQRFIFLSSKYPDPERVPNMSWSAALKALTIQAAQQPTTYAHRRSSPAVVATGIEVTRRGASRSTGWSAP